MNVFRRNIFAGELDGKERVGTVLVKRTIRLVHPRDIAVDFGCTLKKRHGCTRGEFKGSQLQRSRSPHADYASQTRGQWRLLAVDWEGRLWKNNRPPTRKWWGLASAGVVIGGVSALRRDESRENLNEMCGAGGVFSAVKRHRRMHASMHWSMYSIGPENEEMQVASAHSLYDWSKKTMTIAFTAAGGTNGW